MRFVQKSGNSFNPAFKLLHDLLLKCTERTRKTQTRNPGSAAFKPGFRVWQNGRVSPGPGFFKTRVSIPTHHCIHALDLTKNPI